MMKLALHGAILTSFLALPGTSASEPACDLSSEAILGLESEYAFGDLGKLSIIGFEPSVSYVSSTEGKSLSWKKIQDRY